MKLVNIVETNQKGQVVIPKNFRDQLGIDPGDSLEITLFDNHLCLAPVTEVITKHSQESSLADLLTKTQGTWGTAHQQADQKRKLELKASDKRKKAW